MAPSRPSDKTIESTLRRIVRQASKEADLSVNTVRTRAESELDLEPGFLKSSDNGWKEKSKNIVHAAFDAPSSPVKTPSPSSSPKRPSPDSPTTEDAPPSKRRKTLPTSDDEDDEQDDSIDVAPSKKKGTNKPSPPAAEEAVEEDLSDYSDVIDEPPPPKKKRGKKSTSPSDSTTAKPKKSKPSTDTTTTTTTLSPSEEELKRLQSQLVKCGVRRVWKTYLDKFPTPKAKIQHLKEELVKVGMTGRFSAEKAKQIKEQRELQKELEEAKEFNKTFGDGGGGDDSEDEEEGEEDEGIKPRRGKGKKESAVLGEVKPEQRRLPKGFVDFGDSGDEGSD